MSEEQVVEPTEEVEVTETEDATTEPVGATEDVETTEEEKESVDAEKEEEAKKKRRESKVQKRIDKLTREKYLLKGRIEEMERARQPQADIQADDRPTPEQFQSQEDYIDALTDWKIERKSEEIVTKINQKQATASTQTEWSQKLSVAQEQYSDWDDVMEDADDIEVGTHVQEAITSSEVGADVLYYLAKNRDLAQRLSSLPAVVAAREIGKIEARIESGKTASAPVAPKITKAPKPPSTVAPKGAGTKDPDKMSMAEWKVWRNEQLKKRR